MNENAHCYINYVMSGHTITDEIIEKLNYDDLLQHANELGEYTKENLMRFIRCSTASSSGILRSIHSFPLYKAMRRGPQPT